MEIFVTNPEQAVANTIATVCAVGEHVLVRGFDTVELMNFTINIKQPWRFMFDVENRELNQTIGALELAGLIGQTDIDAAGRAHTKVLGRFQDEGVTWGAYGPRIRGLLAPLMAEFAKDMYTRQAVLTIHDSRQDLGTPVKDKPCTLSLQYLYRRGRLYARTIMRSNDAWLGLPYDLMMFCGLQRCIAYWLGVPPGEYQHSVGSMHLYQEHWQKAQDVILAHRTKKYEENFYAPAPFLLPDLRYGVEFCQNVLAGEDMKADTEFEMWLTTNLGRF